MSRFRSKEISNRRLYEAVVRRVFDIPHALAWNQITHLSKRNKEYILGFRDRFKGQRCFIIGNGPSLKLMDLNLLENQFSFGLNRIYLLFNEYTFRPSFYVCVNELVLEQFSHEIRLLTVPKFLNWNRRRLFYGYEEDNIFIRLSLGLHDFFGKDATYPLCGGGTVTYVALQLAFYMGFQEVVLIGVDHNFVDKGIPNTTEVRSTESDRNHFHPNYFAKGTRWQFPDLTRSELAYSKAKETYERAGRKILDATVNGKCPVFKKVEFESLFALG